jgi:hypothetical protein
MKKLQQLGALEAPFPYWGGKAVVAPVIWQRLGDVRHYLEPFAGSLAVLLARPHRPRVETVNDLDGHLVNVYRALAHNPRLVAQHASRPVSSVDLWARHDYVCSQRGALTAQLIADHRFFDAELAGLWIYCASAWTGSGFGWKAGLRGQPHVSHTGSGIHARRRQGHLPRLFAALQTRLRGVRMLCGDWRACLSETILFGSTTPVGLLLDPPYAQERRQARLYATEDDCAAAVRAWALAHGEHPKLRIALCGLAGEHAMPDTWTAYPWQARGGLTNTKHHGRGSGETRQEVVWFSPHCLDAAGRQGQLFPAPPRTP